MYSHGCDPNSSYMDIIFKVTSFLVTLNIWLYNMQFTYVCVCVCVPFLGYEPLLRDIRNNFSSFAMKDRNDKLGSEIKY